MLHDGGNSRLVVRSASYRKLGCKANYNSADSFAGAWKARHAEERSMGREMCVLRSSRLSWLLEIAVGWV